jgi:hypothetical protein
MDNLTNILTIEEQPSSLIMHSPKVHLHLDKNLFLKQLGINVEKYSNIAIEKAETCRVNNDVIILTLGVDLPEDFFTG